MAASCVGRNVRQTAGEKAVTLSRRRFARGQTNSNGSGNLLVGVCALISYEYSFFGVLKLRSGHELLKGFDKTKVTIQAANNAINFGAAIKPFTLPANRV
jgi:hypothetical protein